MRITCGAASVLYSLGWADAGGALRVGPRSAGALPGPASYGRGGRDAAVTDANLALGRLGAVSPLADSLELRPDLGAAALAELGRHVGLDAAATAAGMVAVVESHMTRAIRRVSVEEGVDPRGAMLVAFGGAGGLRASALARGLDMAGVVVPPHAGVFSALGLLLAPPRADAARSIPIGSDQAAVDAAVAEVGGAASAALAVAAVTVRTSVDVRYAGQSHETAVPYAAGDGRAALEERFHRAHRAANGFDRRGDPVEVTTVRAEAEGKPALRWDELGVPDPAGEARRPSRSLAAGGDTTTAQVWWRPALRPGARLAGPCVVEEPEATTYVGPGERATVGESGALVVEW